MREPVSSPLRRRIALALVVAWLAGIFFGSSATPPEAVTGIGAPDWLLHGVEYGVLGFLIARCLLLYTHRTGGVVLVALPGLLALLYGLTDEWHQSFVAGRDPSATDALADLIGGLAGAFTYRAVLLARLRRPVGAAPAAAFALLVLGAGAVAGFDDDPARAAADSIRPEAVHATAAFLASPALRGRDAPSPDLDAAARYIAERFRAAGLVPGAADGTWFQPVPMSFRVDEGRSLVRLLGDAGPVEFRGEDVAVPRESPDGIGGGPLVFAGYGVTAPGAGRDDYAGLDVHGKIVVVFDGLPGRNDPKSPFHRPRDRTIAIQARLAGKAAVAAKQGAVGLIVARGPLDGTVDRLRLADGAVVQGQLTKVSGGYRLRMPAPRRLPVEPEEIERVTLADGSVVTLRRDAGADALQLPAAEVERFYPLDAVLAVEEDVVPLPASGLGRGLLPRGERPSGPLPVLRVSGAAARAIIGVKDLRGLQESLDDRAMSFEAEGRVAVLRVETAKEVRGTRNVVGLWPGRERTDEVLVLTAHYDHVGVGRDGEIYHGADDNASGTAALIAVADAFAALSDPPARPILFVALTAEEKGLIGSAAFVSDPPVPLDSILANLNMDMVGRGPADEIEAFVGTLGTDLDRVLAAAAEPARMRIAFEAVGPADGKMPPPTGREKLSLPVPRTRANLFGRSDHVNFYRKGIPAVFLFGGIHADYHRPTDTAEKLSSERMARASRLVFFTALALAEGGLTRPSQPSEETGRAK